MSVPVTPKGQIFDRAPRGDDYDDAITTPVKSNNINKQRDPRGGGTISNPATMNHGGMYTNTPPTEHMQVAANEGMIPESNGIFDILYNNRFLIAGVFIVMIILLILYFWFGSNKEQTIGNNNATNSGNNRDKSGANNETPPIDIGANNKVETEKDKNNERIKKLKEMREKSQIARTDQKTQEITENIDDTNEESTEDIKSRIKDPIPDVEKTVGEIIAND